jgi:Uma2 family endonuclease
MLAPVTENDRKGKKPATYEDVLNAPEHMVAEILDGELFLSPRPAPRHAHSASILGGILIPGFGESGYGFGGWRILVEPELHLSADIPVPDLAGWKRERMPRLPTQAFFPLAPDWVCEVLSPSTERIDRAKKLRIYAREGVSHIWLINPVLRTLEVFRLERGRLQCVATHGDDEFVRAEPFEAVEIRLSRLWEPEEGPPPNGEAHE